MEIYLVVWYLRHVQESVHYVYIVHTLLGRIFMYIKLLRLNEFTLYLCLVRMYSMYASMYSMYACKQKQNPEMDNKIELNWIELNFMLLSEFWMKGLVIPWFLSRSCILAKHSYTDIHTHTEYIQSMCLYCVYIHADAQCITLEYIKYQTSVCVCVCVCVWVSACLALNFVFTNYGRT